MANRKKYFTEEEKKKAQNEANKKCYQKHLEERRKYAIEYSKKYYQENKQIVVEKAHNKYFENPLRRAYILLKGYNIADKKNNRGEGDLTPEWIVENIYTQKCAHCGESDWRKIGCNRLDNSKPHTKDNVEPCCHKCNSKVNADSSKRDNLGRFA